MSGHEPWGNRPRPTALYSHEPAVDDTPTLDLTQEAREVAALFPLQAPEDCSHSNPLASLWANLRWCPDCDCLVDSGETH